MADKTKTYSPETISETPFPDTTEEILGTTQTTADGNYSPVEIKNNPFPTTNFASELVSRAINTVSRRITSAFQFTKMGAIQIGNYLLGITGDIRISPDGISARDKTGADTFALDGTTGDAFFKGTVQSGSVVSGNITVGGTNNGSGIIKVLDNANVERVTLDKDGIVVNEGKITVKDDTNTTIIDSTGLVSTTNFISDSITTSTLTNKGDSSYSDLDSMTLTTSSFTRNTVVLILFSSNSRVGDNVGAGSNPFTQFLINIDGSDQSEAQAINQQYQDKNTWGGVYQSTSTHAIKTLGIGTHTIKIRWRTGGVGTCTTSDRTLSYIILGK